MTSEQLDEIEALWDTGCLVMAGSYTPQLVKALREALERCETLRQIADQMAYSAGLSARRMEEAQAARDKARAEAARWKEHLRHIAYEHCDSPVHYAMNQLED